MAKARTLAVVFGGALLVIGAFLYLAGGDRRSGEAARAEVSRGAPVSPALEPARAPEILPSEGEAPAVRALVARPAEAERESAAAEGWLEVVLLEAGSRRPVAGAEVWFGPRSEQASAPRPLEVEEFQRGARRAESGADGKVRVALEGRSVCVAARSAGLFGTGIFTGGEGGGARREVVLHPDWDLEIDVLLASGEPAPDVHVRLERRSGSGNSWSEGLRTDARGRARFPHTGHWLEENAQDGRVRVDLALDPELAATLARAEPPRAPVVFRLPPLGSVEVSVLEADRTSVDDGTNVVLGIVRPGEERDLSPFRHAERPVITAATRAGVAVFEHVQLGGELEARAARSGANIMTKDWFPAPQRPGERVRRTLVLGQDHPVLVFRALDLQGKPLAGETLEIREWRRQRWMTHHNERTTRTDEHGTFRVDVEGPFREGDRHTMIVTANAGQRGASVDLAQEFEPGLNQRGDLVLAPSPLLAAGRVVDGAGNAVAGADVGLEARMASREDQADHWNSWQEGQGTKTDAAGAFAVHGFALADELRLTPSSEGKRGTPVEAAPGARGIELVLIETGGVAGALLVDEGIPREEIQVSLVAEDAQDRPGGSWAWGGADVAADGAFHVDGKLPGSYRLKVSLQDDVVLAEFSDVQVIGGETNRDPRLAAIDLRGKLFAFRLHLVLPEPDPDLSGNLTYRPAGGDGPPRWHWFRGNPALLLSRHPVIDATLTVQGYRAVELAGLVSGDREVELRPAILVHLELPAHVTLPASPYYLKAALAGEDGGQIDWGASAFDEARRSSCRTNAGRMKVEWLLERRSGGGASATTLDVEPAQYVEVLDRDGQVFVLEAPVEALAKALADPPF